MRGISHHAALRLQGLLGLAVRALQFVQHAVERGRQLTHFVGRAVIVHAPIEIVVLFGSALPAARLRRRSAGN